MLFDIIFSCFFYYFQIVFVLSFVINFSNYMANYITNYIQSCDPSRVERIWSIIINEILTLLFDCFYKYQYVFHE